MKYIPLGLPYDFSKLYKRLIESYAREFQLREDKPPAESSDSDTASALPGSEEGQ